MGDASDEAGEPRAVGAGGEVGARQPGGHRPLSATKKGAFAAVAVIVAVLGAEGVLRLLGYPRGIVRSFSHVWNRDPVSLERLPGLFQPGVRRHIAFPPELAYHATFNALGLRGPEVTRSRPEGTLRVLAVGDSVTFGYHVADHETWPAHLAARLAGRGLRAEVINGGCGHFTITDQRQYLEERLLSLEPSVVVLQFCSNDVTPGELGRERTLYREILDEAAAPSLGDRLRSTALGELQLRAAIALKAARRGERAMTLAAPEPVDDAAWARYEEELAALKRALDARGVPLVLVSFVDLGVVLGDGPSVHDGPLATITARLKIPFASALPAFRAAGPDPRALFLWPRDPHSSSAGNAVLAGVVEDLLGAHGLLGAR